IYWPDRVPSEVLPGLFVGWTIIDLVLTHHYLWLSLRRALTTRRRSDSLRASSAIRLAASCGALGIMSSMASALRQAQLLAPGLHTVHGDSAREQHHHEIAVLVLADHIAVGRDGRKFEEALHALHGVLVQVRHVLVLGPQPLQQLAASAGGQAFGAYFHGTCLPGHQHRIVYALACKGRGEQHGIRVVLRRLAAPGFHFQKAQNAFHIGLRYAAPAGAAKSFMGVCCGGLSQGSSRGSWPCCGPRPG